MYHIYWLSVIAGNYSAVADENPPSDWLINFMLCTVLLVSTLVSSRLTLLYSRAEWETDTSDSFI